MDKGTIELHLAAIWREVLGAKSISSQDMFLDLGGDSLSAIHCISRIRSAFGVELTLEDLCLRGFSLELLAAKIDEGRSTEFESQLQTVEHASHSDHGCLASTDIGPSVTVNQGKFLFATEQRRAMGKHPRTFNVASVLHLEGPLVQTILERTLNEIIARHDILRTTYLCTQHVGRDTKYSSDHGSKRANVVTIDMFRHHVKTGVTVKLSTTSVEPLEPSEQMDVLRKVVKEASLSAITELPNLTAVLVRISSNSNMLVMVLPHLTGDGHSLQILKREIAQIYAALLAKQYDSLPSPVVQFDAFVGFQNRYLNSPSVRAAVNYWTRQWLDFAPAQPKLADFPRAGNRGTKNTPHIRQHRLTIDRYGSDRLRASLTGLNVTLFMFLFSTLSLAIQRRSKRPQLALLSNFANRVTSEFEPTIGWFVNTHLLGIDLGSDLTFYEVLLRAKSTIVNAHIHQGLPTTHLWNILGERPAQNDLSVLFDFRSWDNLTSGTSPLKVSELSLSAFMIWPEISRSLHIIVTEMTEEIEFLFLFNSSLLSKEGMRSLLYEWVNLSQIASQNPYCHISELSSALEVL